MTLGGNLGNCDGISSHTYPYVPGSGTTIPTAPAAGIAKWDGSDFNLGTALHDLSGTATLGTSSISSGACASVVTVAATGVATTDVVTWTPNASIKAVTGYMPSTSGALRIAAYPTSGSVEF